MRFFHALGHGFSTAAIGGFFTHDESIAYYDSRALYVASFGVMYLALASTGFDLITSFLAIAACMNIPGPGLGDVGANYANLNDAANWTLCIAMLLGRWEIFTLPVLLPSVFWRHQGS